MKNTLNVNKKLINKIICNTVVYASVYENADVFNPICSDIEVALDENLSTVDENPLTYLPKNYALYMYLKPIVTVECSKIIIIISSMFSLKSLTYVFKKENSLVSL